MSYTSQSSFGGNCTVVLLFSRKFVFVRQLVRVHCVCLFVCVVDSEK